MGMEELLEVLLDGVCIQANNLADGEVQLIRCATVELVEHLQADAGVAGEDGRGQGFQLALGNGFALVDFLKGRVGGEHAGKDVLEAAAVDHGFAGTGDVHRALVAQQVAILGFGGSYAITRPGAGLTVFHDAAQFLTGVFQLVDARLQPEVGAADFGDQSILLAYGLDVDGELVQLDQQGNFAVLEAGGLLDQAALNTGDQLIQRGGVLVAQHAGRHQRGNGVGQQVLGFAIELLQLLGLLQLVHGAQFTLYRHAGVGQVVDVGTQQGNGGVKGCGMVVA